MCYVSTQQANPFGQPFLFQIEDDETLDDVKPRIQVPSICSLARTANLSFGQHISPLLIYVGPGVSHPCQHALIAGSWVQSSDLNQLEPEGRLAAANNMLSVSGLLSSTCVEMHMRILQNSNLACVKTYSKRSTLGPAVQCTLEWVSFAYIKICAHGLAAIVEKRHALVMRRQS